FTPAESHSTELYPLPLHDALPIYLSPASGESPTISIFRYASSSISHCGRSRYSRIGSWIFSLTVSEENSAPCWKSTPRRVSSATDRKSTRLNSSHVKISYAVFCLK